MLSTFSRSLANNPIQRTHSKFQTKVYSPPLAKYSRANFRMTFMRTRSPLLPDVESDGEWKGSLKRTIQVVLRSMIDKVEKMPSGGLARAPVDLTIFECLIDHHIAVLKIIHRLAEEQFRITLEQEWQERWWDPGPCADRELEEYMMEEQQAGTGTGWKNKAPATPLPGSLQTHPLMMPPSDLEPDDAWKRMVKKDIQTGLHLIVDKAKQKLRDELARGTSGPEECDRFVANQFATLENIRWLEEEKFKSALEQERRKRRLVSSSRFDQAGLENIVGEQLGIVESPERGRKNKFPATFLQPGPTQVCLTPLVASPGIDPDEGKCTLNKNTQKGLRSMINEARQKCRDALTKGTSGPEEHNHFVANCFETVETIRKRAEEKFESALERERRKRRLASGPRLDQALESTLKEQQTILERIERERKNKLPAAPLEPDNEWKRTAKKNIQAGLYPMVNEAKQKLRDELSKETSGPEGRDRFVTNHFATLESIGWLAEEQFRIALERERRERQRAAGERLDREWSEKITKEQKAILESIEREKKNKALAESPRSNSAQFPRSPLLFQFQPTLDALPSAPTPSTSNRKMKTKGVDRTPTQIARLNQDAGPDFPNFKRDKSATPADKVTSSRSTCNIRARTPAFMDPWNASSPLDLENSFLECSNSSSIFGKAKFVPCSTAPTASPDPTFERSVHLKASGHTGSMMHEFWKPSVMREDTQVSHPFTLAKRKRNTCALRGTSSCRPPSVCSVAFTEPLDALSPDVDRE